MHWINAEIQTHMQRFRTLLSYPLELWEFLTSFRFQRKQIPIWQGRDLNPDLLLDTLSLPSPSADVYLNLQFDKTCRKKKRPYWMKDFSSISRNVSWSCVLRIQKLLQVWTFKFVENGEIVAFCTV